MVQSTVISFGNSHKKVFAADVATGYYTRQFNPCLLSEKTNPVVFGRLR
jgi:hypothetical protein